MREVDYFKRYCLISYSLVSYRSLLHGFYMLHREALQRMLILRICPLDDLLLSNYYGTTTANVFERITLVT